MSDCSICCEPFNKSNRSKIVCKTCDNDETVTCRSCAIHYILDKPTEPSCMVCNVEWDIDFLCDNFTKQFINKDLKKHKENYLLDKQIALLPETQEYAENLKFINNLEKQKEIMMIEKKNLENKLKKLNHNISTINNTINDARVNINNDSDNKKVTREFTFKCPIDNCNGFLNDKYECGLCDNKICKKCMEIKKEDHQCDEDKIKTVELLKKDTKPCPKCGQFIYKINGCDQMYCIKCHTAFSWRTGCIERGNVHNPEYYRWMRESGQEIPRNPLDEIHNPCGDNIIRYYNLLAIMRTFYPPANAKDSRQTIIIANMHRLIEHINFLNREYRMNERDNFTNLRNMRANYLLNNLTKENFKKKLQMIEKKNMKDKKMNDVWNLLRLILIEYIGKIVENRYDNIGGAKIINDIIKESDKIRLYCNESFTKIGNTFNMTYPGINNDWIDVNNWKEYIKHNV